MLSNSKDSVIGRKNLDSARVYVCVLVYLLCVCVCMHCVSDVNF